MDERRVAGAGVVAGDPIANVGIAIQRGLAEGEAAVVAATAATTTFVARADLVGEAEVGVEMGRSDRLRRREGLEGRGEDDHDHRCGEEAGKFNDPQHLSPAIGDPAAALPSLEVEEIGKAGEDGEG